VVLFKCWINLNNSVSLKEMKSRVYNFTGVAALNQYIYVVGGYDGHRQLNTVERYDTEKDCWDSVASIRTVRSALSLTVLDGKLYAMGEFPVIILIKC
jgi:kelch-like protein 19